MIAAVVLAAGEASRFGSPKQRLMLGRVLERVRGSAVEEIVVVEGAYDLQVAVCNLEARGGITVPLRLVRCPEWQRGMGASLRCGLAALPEGAEAAVVVLADGPDLAPEAVDRVIAAWRDGRGDVVAASYDGARGHPVVLGRAAWASVPDEGARMLEPALVPCDDLDAPGDVDTPDDMPDELRPREA